MTPDLIIVLGLILLVAFLKYRLHNANTALLETYWRGYYDGRDGKPEQSIELH